MARFDRKVERTRKEYQFTQKTEEKKEESLSSIFKENFCLRWMRFNLQSILGYVLDFLIGTLIAIPLLTGWMDATLAFVLGHAIFTGLLLVATTYFIQKEKPKLAPFLVRYLFIALLLGASSYLAIVLTAWLS